MVLPAQNIPIPSINTEFPATPDNKSAAETREEVTDLFPQNAVESSLPPEVEKQNPVIDEQAKPGKVVDLSTKKFTDIPIETTDKITTIADRDEEEFREGVNSKTADEQHS